MIFLNKKVRKNLRIFLEQKGIIQKFTAQQVGISKAAMSRFVNGHLDLSEATLLRIQKIIEG